MALSTTQKSLCNKLVADYYNVVAPVKASKSVLKKYASDLDSYLRALSYSPSGDLTTAITNFGNSVSGFLPGTDTGSMTDLKDFIGNCDYFSEFVPTTVASGLSSGTFDNIDSLIDSTTITIPEFGAGKIADSINNLLSGTGLPGGDALTSLLQKADKLINCLSGLCAAIDASYVAGLSTITTDLQNLYTELNIVDNPVSSEYGNFDYETLYNNIGMTTSQKSAIDTVKSAITTQKVSAKTAITNSVASIKSLVKIGGFF